MKIITQAVGSRTFVIKFLTSEQLRLHRCMHVHQVTGVSSMHAWVCEVSIELGNLLLWLPAAGKHKAVRLIASVLALT